LLQHVRQRLLRIQVSSEIDQNIKQSDFSCVLELEQELGDCQRDFDPVPVHSQPNLQKLPEVATSHDLIVLEDSSNETNDDSVNPDKNSRMASTVEQIDALQTFVSSEPGLDTSDV